MFYCH